jgi:phospholipase/carboxylesterase
MEEIVLQSGNPEPQKLVFIFHGYGADKNDMIPVGQAFGDALRSAEVHLPNGPDRCDGLHGYQWFPLYGDDVAGWKSAFEENSHKIVSYVDAIVAEKHLTYDDVIFSGFSQGAILSLNLGLRCRVRAVISFSGVLFDFVPKGEIPTKILLTHGIQDDVIDISAATSAECILKNAGVQVETDIRDNFGHGIDQQMLSRAVDFLKSL